MADITTVDEKLDCVINTAGGTAVDVGTSSTLIVSAHASTKYVLIVNNSDTVIYIRLGGAAALNQGIRLNPNGGAYEISSTINKYAGAIYGIHGGSGSKRVLVTHGW